LENVEEMIMGANGVLKTMINLGDLDSKMIQMMFSAQDT